MRGTPNGPPPGAKEKESTKDKVADAASEKGTAQRLKETRGKSAAQKAKVVATEAAVQIASKFGIPPQVVRVASVAVFGLLSLLVVLMFMLLTLAVAGSIRTEVPHIDGNAAQASRPTKKTVPARYATPFKKSVERYGEVPWTLLAAISQLGTDMGQVSPYPEDTIDRDPKRDNLRTPGGGSAAGSAGAGAPVAATDAKVFILGDSVTVGVAEDLQARLTGAGWQVEIDAAVSRGLTMKGQQGQPTGNEALDAAVSGNKIGGTLVVALGTNGPDTVNAASIDAVMSKVPPTTRVFWPTVAYGAGASGNPAGANAALAEARARHANLVVLEWRPNPAELDRYGHTNTPGAKTARVDLIANALGSYVGSVTTPTPTSAAPTEGPDPDAKVSWFPKVSPPIGTDTQAQGPFLIYPSAVTSRLDPQDMRTLGGRRPKTATDWMSQQLNAIKVRLVRDEGWAFSTVNEKAAVWTEAVRQLPVADPIEAACVATIWDVTLDEDVANAIEGLWRCELNYAKELNLRSVAPEDDSFVAVPDPSTAATTEALQVAWAFSGWGQEPCDPNGGGPQGVFPLTQEVFDEHNDGYDGKTRCDPLANIHAAVRAFAKLEAEKVGEGSRSADPGKFNPIVGGWAAMPWALGNDASREKLLADGPVPPAAAPLTCAGKVDEWIGSLTGELGPFAPFASSETVDGDDLVALGEVLAELPAPPIEDPACVGTPSGTWGRLVADRATSATAGFSQRDPELVTTDPNAPAPEDGADLDAAVTGLSGLAVYFKSLAAAADDDTAARPGVDAVVQRLSSNGRILADAPEMPASTSRVSYAQQVVALARAMGGISLRDRTLRDANPWEGADTPEGKTAPLALRVKSAPSGEQLAGAAARSVGAPARGVKDPTGVRFVRRTFASIDAPPPSPDLGALEVAGTEVVGSDVLPGDVLVITFTNGTRRVGIIVAGGNYIYDPGDGTPVRLAPILDARPIPGPEGEGVTYASVTVRRFLPPRTMQQAVSGTAGGMSIGLAGFPDAAIQAAWDRWGALFVAAGQQHQIDPLIPFAFAWIETSFVDAHIYCRNGLRPTWGNGLMQFTSQTAASYGIDPCVPEQAIPAGTLFIKRLMDSHNGDLRLAAMGYNAGPAVSAAAAKCGCWPTAAFDRYYGGRSTWKQGITRKYTEGPDSLPGKYEKLKQYAQVANNTVLVGGGPVGAVGAQTGNIVVAAGIRVDSSIAANVEAMVAAAAAEGVRLSGGGFRDPAGQLAVRRNNCGTSHYAIYEMPSSSCRPPTARPGTSMHEKGLAIDFENCSTRGTACHQWLARNAARFGLQNFPKEPWHWSTNGN